MNPKGIPFAIPGIGGEPQLRHVAVLIAVVNTAQGEGTSVLAYEEVIVANVDKGAPRSDSRKVQGWLDEGWRIQTASAHTAIQGATLYLLVRDR